MDWFLVAFLLAAFVAGIMYGFWRLALKSAKYWEAKANEAVKRVAWMNDESDIIKKQLREANAKIAVDKPFTELGRRRQVSLDKAEAKRQSSRPVKAAPKKK